MVTEGLDIEQHGDLIAYLRRTGRIGGEERPVIRSLNGGVSNRVVLVERSTGEAWVLKQALAKLRVAVDWFSSPERVHREAAGLRWLEWLAPPKTITPLEFEDHENHLIAMRAVPQPHDNWKAVLLDGRLERSHVEQFGRILAAIHRSAYECREEVAQVFDDRSFFESLRIEPYYSYTATQVPSAAGFLHALIDETCACRVTLVHGDYSPKNILIHREALVLLDHEVIHFGDPAFDLGFSLTHLLSKAHHLADRRTEFADVATLYWHVYRQIIGNVPWAGDLESRAVRHTLACLLARVSGRSTLEYLSASERARQQQIALELMSIVPTRIPELTHRFVTELDERVPD